MVVVGFDGWAWWNGMDGKNGQPGIALHGWKFLEHKPAAAGKSGAWRFLQVKFWLEKRDRISGQLANAGAASYLIRL